MTDYEKERREDSIAISKQVTADLERHLKDEEATRRLDADYKKRNDDHVRAIYANLQMASSKIDVLQSWVTDNAEVTREVRDLLATFRVSRNVANWTVRVGGAVALGYAWLKGWGGK